VRATVVLVALGAAACDWSLHRMQQQPRCMLHEPTPLLPGGACDLEPPDGTIPFAAAGAPIAQPLPPSRALILRGRDRFDRFCAPCHGPLGDGDSAIARDMRLRRPPSLVDGAAASLSDDRIVWVMARGYGLMPAYGGALAPRDRWAVLYYVRVLERRELALDALPAAIRAEAPPWLK
jgi:mono/diheme cytochrome c family protein